MQMDVNDKGWRAAIFWFLESQGRTKLRRVIIERYERTRMTKQAVKDYVAVDCVNHSEKK